MIVAVDASVLIKWYIPEAYSEPALEFRDWVLKGHHKIAAPSYLLVETTNVLWKKTVLLKELKSGEAHGILREVQKLQVHFIPDGLLLEDTLATGIQDHVSVYDALYLAAAKRFGSFLMTADRELVRRGGHTDKVIHINEWKKVKNG